jgi:type II secretory pathway component PulF
MPVFGYKAMAKSGQVISNKLKAENEKEVRDRLTKMGYKPISVKKKSFDANEILGKLGIVKPQKNQRAAIGIGEAISVADQDLALEEQKLKAEAAKPKKTWKEMLTGDVSFGGFDLSKLTAYLPVKIDEVVSFTEMFLLLKKSNFTNIRAIQTMYTNATNQALKSIMGDMLNGLETGGYIYSTMEYYNHVFPEMYTKLIRVGEESGSLVNSLEQALKYLQDSIRIKRSVKKALMGPLMQSAFLLIFGVICIIVGIPIMQDMYASYGLTDQIPKETMAAANFIYWCGDHWYILVAIVVGLIIAFKAWISTNSGRYTWDKFKITMPVFGPLILRLQVQKFFVAVNINLKNNARLQDAISDCKQVVTNYVLKAAVEVAEANLIVGDSWIEPFERMKQFPPMIKEMLKIGMETNMMLMIENILNFIDEDIRITIERITKVLPTVSMTFMGVILIGFVIIILKPIMEVYMGSFLFEANGM